MNSRITSMDCIVGHPNRLIAFRESRAVKAKTDPIDARLIRAFTSDQLSRGALRPSLLGDDRLRELAARRRQLTQTLQAERCRLAVARGAMDCPSIFPGQARGCTGAAVPRPA